VAEQLGGRQKPLAEALLSALGLALGLAWAGQQLLTPLGASRELGSLPDEHVGLGFALLFVAGLIGGAVVWLSRPAPVPPPAIEPVADRRYADTRLLRASLFSGGLATALAFFAPFNSVAIYPWALALSLLVVACMWPVARSAVPGTARQGRAPIVWSEIGLLCLLLTVAAIPRLFDLDEIPAQVHGDEAACGIAARAILAGNVSNLLGVGWYDIPYLSFAISACSMAVFGDDLFGLRIISAILGVGSVGLLYFLVRRLYGLRAAGLASFLMAVSHWHVHFSRIGTDYMQASFAGLLALLFFVRALQDGRLLDWLVAGLAIGLAASVYPAGRVVPLMIGAYLALEWLRDRAASRRRRGGVALMVMAAVLFVAPTIAVMARMPSTLTDRSSDIFVFSPANLQHTYESTRVDDPIHVLALQLRHSLAAFNRRGERSEQHSHRAPLLDYWSAPVFAVGLVAFTMVGWMPGYRLIGMWFWLNLLLGSVLTVDAMFSPRMIVALPVVFVFPALILDRAWSLSRRALGRPGAWLAGALTVMFLALSARANYADYFDLHVRVLQPAGPSTILSRYVADNSAAYRVYVIGRFSMSYDTARFLVPDFDGVDAGTGVLDLPVTDPPRQRGLAFVIDRSWSGWSRAEAAVVAAYPQARRSTLDRANGRAVFGVLTLESAQLGRDAERVL